jgi:thiol:disulfide interchange protein DsbD
MLRLNPAKKPTSFPASTPLGQGRGSLRAALFLSGVVAFSLISSADLGWAQKEGEAAAPAGEKVAAAVEANPATATPDQAEKPEANPAAQKEALKKAVAEIASCPDIPEGDGDSDTAAAGAGTSSSGDSGGGGLEERVQNALSSGNFILAALLVLFAGFLTALSPCVYPLIPVTLSILGARQSSSHLQGFFLSACYVAGMVILYSVLGVAFSAMGFLAGSALQSPFITVGIAFLFLILAASMFGAFEFVLPASVMGKLSQVGGGGYKGAFLMGLVAGIIAAPCTGPVLSFILTLIAKDGDLVRGAAFMVLYALGMGFPFLVLGTFSSAISSMPKSGKWMESVKSVFGLMMVVAAVYYLQFGLQAVSAGLEELAPLGIAGALVLTVAGVAVGALHLSFKHAPPLEKARKGVGVTLASLGLLTFMAHAQTDAVPPLPDDQIGEITWNVVSKEKDAMEKFDRMLSRARTECRPVMVDFYADWCVACKELDKYTYPDVDVRRESMRFFNIKVDATDDTDALQAIQDRYEIVGLPTVLFFDSHGRLKKKPRVTGFVKPEPYARILKRVR